MSIIKNKEILKPAAFLDRDGVINYDYGHVGSLDRFKYVNGALEAICFLKSCGFRVFVVTNQAGIAKAKYTWDEYQQIMSKIDADLGQYSVTIDDVRACPYHPKAKITKYFHEDHPWRKPNPGMLLDLMQNWNVDTRYSFLIGDNDTDILAAKKAGITGHLFQSQKNLLVFVTKLTEVLTYKGDYW